MRVVRLILGFMLLLSIPTFAKDYKFIEESMVLLWMV